MVNKSILVFTVIACLLSACARAPEPYPTLNGTELPNSLYTACFAAPGSHQGPSETPFPTVTETPPPPAPTNTATPFLPFSVAVMVENVNLRSNPGYLFPVIRILRQGTILRVSGRSPGGEWFYAAAPDGLEGWVFGMLLDADARLPEVPLRVPLNALTLQGRVLDGRAIPIQGVVFGVMKGSGPNAPVNTVVTDSSGMFYSFMPVGSNGKWTVTHTAIACLSNVWQPGGCESYKPEYQGLVEPPSVEITLPHDGLLMFTWK
jgi:hypothetical protein